jgi:hypothetical protein
VPSGTDLKTPVESFKDDVMPIFDANCGSSSCHGSAAAPTGGIFLGASTANGSDSAEVYVGLVGPGSEELPSMPYVTPGAPSLSYLQHKLDGDQCHYDAECAGESCVAAMPNGGMLLPVATRDVVRRWIAQGAKDN